MQEKREFKRFNVEVPIMYRSLDLKDYMVSKTENVSLGGLSAKIDLHAHRNRLLQFKMVMPQTNEIVEFVARLSWGKRIGESSYEAGFELVDVVTNFKDQVGLLLNNLTASRN